MMSPFQEEETSSGWRSVWCIAMRFQPPVLVVLIGLVVFTTTTALRVRNGLLFEYQFKEGILSTVARDSAPSTAEPSLLGSGGVPMFDTIAMYQNTTGQYAWKRDGNGQFLFRTAARRSRADRSFVASVRGRVVWLVLTGVCFCCVVRLSNAAECARVGQYSDGVESVESIGSDALSGWYGVQCRVVAAVRSNRYGWRSGDAFNIWYWRLGSE